MRLQGGQAWMGHEGRGMPVIDVMSGSVLTFTDYGEVWGRDIVTAAQNAELNPNRDVGALFDQIVASVRRK